MKLRWKIAVGLVVIGVLGVFFFLRSGSNDQKALEETRRALRQQGFKVDLTEFDFSTSAEMRDRAAAIANANFLSGADTPDEFARLSAFREDAPDLMARIGPDSALVVWKQATLGGTYFTGDVWTGLREVFQENRTVVDKACEAALAGPIRFDLVATNGVRMLLPHLASLRMLAQTLGKRATLELHDGNKEAAWTNLTALTRLATAYDPEAAEVSHLVRFACAVIAYNSTWQTLQANGWTDDQLANLQREWEAVNFFRGLPEIAAFSRACYSASCQLDRQEQFSLGMMMPSGILRSPRATWIGFTEDRRRLNYRHHGVYEDEKNLLLYYRDRELELRRAVRSSNWSEMQQLPGITNVVSFQSKYPSLTKAMLNLRQLTVSWLMYSSPDQGQGLFGRAADAESRRRLVVTAIGLERYRGRHGSYPKSLAELTPEFLKAVPLDFMDGKPLRYRLGDDGHFVLYSVGADCIDNGGATPRSRRRDQPYEGPRELGVQRVTDLVWPRPASTAEVEVIQKEQLNASQMMEEQSVELQAEHQWRRTAARQAGVEKLLAAKPKARTVEPTYRGRPLSEVLRNRNSSGTNKLTLDELLTLRQVLTGEEPEVVTFELPIAHDVLPDIAELELFIDPVVDEDSDEGCHVGQSEITRATNGNCLLVWHTIYESHGKHALQAGLLLHEPAKSGDYEYVPGPLVPFVVTNLCQFSLSSAHFNPALGATLHAKLPESNGTYAIEITSPAGERLKTITGSTSNGVIKVHWDLIDESGRRCTNDSFGTLFHIALPDSGRSQTLKGP